VSKGYDFNRKRESAQLSHQFSFFDHFVDDQVVHILAGVTGKIA